MAKSRRSKKLSYDELIAQLKQARKEYREFERGQRKTLYRFLQRSAELALSAEANKTNRSQFRKEVGEEDVLRGALIFIFDSKSKSELKEISKRLQALRYLIDKLKVSVEEIAAALDKHGGIEKLAKLAAESRKAEKGGAKDQSDEDPHDEDPDDEDRDTDDQEDGGIENEENLDHAGEVEETKPRFGKLLEVGLSPKQAKKLDSLDDNARIKLIGRVRTSRDGDPTVEVEKVITKFKSPNRTPAAAAD